MTVDATPTVNTVLETINKVCDLPDHDEKWALLKSLNDILAISVYPAMVVGTKT